MKLHKKEIAGIIYSIAFTLIISIVVYNFRVIVKYAFNVNSNAIIYHAIIRFFCYFFFSLFFVSKFKTRNTFFILFLPVLAIDATTLLAGRELMPLRFPFDTIYPLLGILTVTIYQRSKSASFIILASSLVFMILAQTHIRPLILWKMHENNQPISQKYFQENDIYLTTAGEKVTIRDTLEKKISLIEFYYVGCLPCEEKYTAIKEIYNKYKDEINVILICDGQASQYNFFLKHWENNKHENITFLYDFNKNLSKYNLSGFPTEFIVKGRSIINVDQGFGNAIYDKWLKKEHQILNNLINGE